ncbi:hypothetical protein FAI41_04610 [Acetobacteraceae bacterium]|nr:hypothetical protein FAI41_04610 [Acetobacteraceae bacterium]
MKNKIQKWGLLAGILMMGASVFPLPSMAAEKALENNAETVKIPDFLPKDYKITSILWGEWKAQKDEDDSDTWPTRYLSFSTPGNGFTSDRIDISVDVMNEVNKWEVVHHAPFKMKTSLHIQLHPNTGFSCIGGDITLWFDNGESFDLIQNGECDIKDLWDEWSFLNPEVGYHEPVEEYRLSKLISSHKPVALTQGKRVILMKAPDEKAFKEYRDMITPEYLQTLKTRYEKSSKDPEIIKWASHPPEKRGN